MVLCLNSFFVVFSNAGDPSNQKGNQGGSGEIVDESQQEEEEEQERGGQRMEDEDVQNNLVKTSLPLNAVRMIVSYSLFPYNGDPLESKLSRIINVVLDDIQWYIPGFIGLFFKGSPKARSVL